MVVLSWHVDYWDRLGWKDTFGSKEATERQKRYAAARGLKGLQTPQFFAANRPVGGDALAEAVKKEAEKKPRFAIEGHAVRKKKVVFEGSVKLAEEVGHGEEEAPVPPIADGPPSTLTVQAVLYARRAETKCDAGENKGRTLVEHWAVVAVGKAVPIADARKKGLKAEFAAPEGIAELGVAILIEDPTKMETVECAAFPVSGE